jgi:hypothetical protein
MQMHFAVNWILVLGTCGLSYQCPILWYLKQGLRGLVSHKFKWFRSSWLKCTQTQLAYRSTRKLHPDEGSGSFYAGLEEFFTLFASPHFAGRLTYSSWQNTAVMPYFVPRILWCQWRIMTSIEVHKTCSHMARLKNSDKDVFTLLKSVACNW